MDKLDRLKVCMKLVDRRMGCTVGGAVQGTGVSEAEAIPLLEELVQEGILAKQVVAGKATWYELTRQGCRTLVDRNIALGAELYRQASK